VVRRSIDVTFKRKTTDVGVRLLLYFFRTNILWPKKSRIYIYIIHTLSIYLSLSHTRTHAHTHARSLLHLLKKYYKLLKSFFFCTDVISTNCLLSPLPTLQLRHDIVINFWEELHLRICHLLLKKYVLIR